jgi:hypothetical protein
MVVQLFAQVPQYVSVFSCSSHPSELLLLQSPYPVLHDPIAQLPALQ